MIVSGEVSEGTMEVPGLSDAERVSKDDRLVNLETSGLDEELAPPCIEGVVRNSEPLTVGLLVRELVVLLERLNG